MMQVQDRQCATCIYRPDSPLNVKKLERQISDGCGGFRSHRICHHSDDVVCRGFWDRYKHKFNLGRIAQRLNMVRFVHVDNKL